MTRQRQILVTVTYNDLGCIIDTKAEPYEEPNLQPTCNQLATVAKDICVPCKDSISRQAAIDALKGLPTWWADSGGYYGVAQPPMIALLDPEDAVSAIENLPSAQPNLQPTCNNLATDCISRQAALDCVTYDEEYTMECIKKLPSAQSERLTDDDFETIRIHLSAHKERLCNQHRWEEAEEYQRIIDRFMKFASAQQEIIHCRDCKYYYFADNRIPQEQRYTCELNGDRWKADDFCSYAERRTDEDD